MTQLTFEFAELVEPAYSPDLTIQQRYEQWRTRELRAA